MKCFILFAIACFTLIAFIPDVQSCPSEPVCLPISLDARENKGLPANIPALMFQAQRYPRGEHVDEEFDIEQVTFVEAHTGEPVAHHIEEVGRLTYLLTLDEPLAEGEAYILTSTLTCHAYNSTSPVTTSLPVIEKSPMPEPGILPTHVELTHHAGNKSFCNGSHPYISAKAEVEVPRTGAYAQWHDLIWWEARVNDKLIDYSHTLELEASCDPDVNLRGNLPEGDYIIHFTGYIPGTDRMWTTEPERVELRCERAIGAGCAHITPHTKSRTQWPIWACLFASLWVLVTRASSKRGANERAG